MRLTIVNGRTAPGIGANRGTGPKDKRVRRQPSRDPLILAGHGVSLRIEAGTLLIRNGFTHYPQKQETYRYFKGDADLPPRIIMLDGSGSITFDVLTLAQRAEGAAGQDRLDRKRGDRHQRRQLRRQSRPRRMADRNAIEPAQAHGVLQRPHCQEN